MRFFIICLTPKIILLIIYENALIYKVILNLQKIYTKFTTFLHPKTIIYSVNKLNSKNNYSNLIVYKGGLFKIKNKQKLKSL